MEIGTTTSTCTAQFVRGRHLFLIAEYSLNKGIGVGNFIRSKIFNVGEYDWSIRYYPDGLNRQSQKYISILAELMSENAEVRAQFSFRLLGMPQNTEWRGIGVSKISNLEGTRRSIAGCEKFMERSVLEGWESMRSDRFIIECFITILRDPLVLENEPSSSEIKVPPSELSNDFAKLLASKEGADVTFFVEGDAFPAHRAVLAARSTVFKAELYGPMMEKEESCITVDDMLPDVFRALLHFIYSDSLLPLDDFDDDGRKEIVRHLLSAADRYAIERLKLICENILCKNLDVETVATTFVLADQHQCNNLKDACLKFMGSPTRMDKVMASQDYESLKRKSPNIAVEVLESVCKFPKI